MASWRSLRMGIVLASSSPRRRRLLKRILPSIARQETEGGAFRICRRFSVRAADIEERIHDGESFRKAAERLAKEKAIAVSSTAKQLGRQRPKASGSSENPASVVIGADTIAYLGKKNFRKTQKRETAERVLLELGGKTHYVVTGVCVIYPSGKCVKYSVKAAVKMKKYGEKDVMSYLRTDEWRGRAGCYDYSGKGRKLVEKVRGEKETVVGLPLLRLRKLLLRR